jgi:hypothetical protein
MTPPSFFQKIKKSIIQYLTPTDWPWEIISGLFIVLLLINNAKILLKEWKLSKTAILAFIIIIITLFWAILEGLMAIFAALLEKGRYNRMISRLKSADKNTSLEIITNELEKTVVGIFDGETKKQIAKEMFEKISSISPTNLEKPKISKDDMKGALFRVFFVFSPCIVILPFFVSINNLSLAILVSNIIGLAMLFGFGYRLGSCTDRNKILTGLVIMIIGVAIIIMAIVLGA